LTAEERCFPHNTRAGEGYFSSDGKTIIYQAEEKTTGNPFYQIFTQDLASSRVTRVSPGVGKTTCAFFHPTARGKKRGRSAASSFLFRA